MDSYLNRISNWVPLPETVCSFLSETLGDTYQIPILAPKGALVLWLSSTVHSAVHPTSLISTSVDPRANGRMIVYLCYRPKEWLSKANLKTSRRALFENRGTNHAVTRLTSKNTDSYSKLSNYSSTIQTFIKDPTQVYEHTFKPYEDPEICLLCG